MHPEAPEPFVDAVVAAEFLKIKRRRILELARAGVLPSYPLGEGVRRVWRFRLSELSAAMEQRQACAVCPTYPSNRKSS